jgi:ketol-acid reductoisomerase
MNAADNGFTVGTYEDLIPTADLVCNLTPDKPAYCCSNSYNAFDERSSALAYSHGFNIVEEGMQIRKRYYSNYVCSQMSRFRGT